MQTVMVFLTLIVSAINLNDGETNAIEGMTHFVLFATFIMLSLLGLVKPPQNHCRSEPARDSGVSDTNR